MPIRSWRFLHALRIRRPDVRFYGLFGLGPRPDSVFSGPGVALWVARADPGDVSVDVHVGGEDNDLGVSVSGLGQSVRVDTRGMISPRWRVASRRWAEARAAELNRTRPLRLGRVYSYELDPAEGRTTGVAWDAETRTVWLRVWVGHHGVFGSTLDAWPWNGPGWTATINVRDLVRGRAVVEARDVEQGELEVKLPERTYAATFRVTETRQIRRGRAGPWQRCVTVDVPDGIPIPGKGENDYDLGDDAVYGISTEGPTPHDVHEQLVASVLRTRAQYGGTSWAPYAGWDLSLQDRAGC